MPTQYKRSWVLLTSLASCAGLATTPAFAVEPHALMQLVQAGDTQYISGCMRMKERSVAEERACDLRVRVSFGGNNAETQPAENAQSMYLIKLLESSSQFRVRAQAAISLGVMESSVGTRTALTAALKDEHPAVRAAAATSLGRIGDANHVIALRTLAGDPEAPVRNAARASIDKLETLMPAVLDAATTTAALTTTTSANRL